MKVLVSGIAGDIGFGISRILRSWGIFDQIDGMDVSEDHPGQLVLDECQKAPRADDANYLDWLDDYIKRRSIDLFIPTSEAELLRISNAEIHELSGAKVLINRPDIIGTCLDKFATLNFLRSKDIAVPQHGRVGVDHPGSFPVIVKPRQGRGSKGLQVISSATGLPEIGEGYVWQEHLVPDSEEYTCALYMSPAKECRTLSMKRRLVGGYTGMGEVVIDNAIDAYVKAIGRSLQVEGCINIQLRNTERGPLLFEINPRISSTVVFRDILGFQDLKWWISDVLNLPSLEYKKPIPGTKFYRGNAEYVIYPS